METLKRNRILEQQLKNQRRRYNEEQPPDERYTLSQWIEYKLNNWFRGQRVILKGNIIYFIDTNN
jgi:hypothetical protein